MRSVPCCAAALSSHPRSNAMCNCYPSDLSEPETLEMSAASPLARYAFLLLAACSLAVHAQAQKAPAAYEPTVGQEGKDVVWVPTPQALVDKMLDMAKVTPADFLMDLGSGDGRT